jgi:hypothetical protein
MMTAPFQAPPVRRLFMRLIVGREWTPAAEEAQSAEGWPTKKGGRRKVIQNPSLIQLTTCAIRELRRQLRTNRS